MRDRKSVLIVGLKRCASLLPMASMPMSHFGPSGTIATEAMPASSPGNRNSRCTSRMRPQRGLPCCMKVANGCNAGSERSTTCRKRVLGACTISEVLCSSTTTAWLAPKSSRSPVSRPASTVAMSPPRSSRMASACTLSDRLEFERATSTSSCSRRSRARFLSCSKLTWRSTSDTVALPVRCGRRSCSSRPAWCSKKSGCADR